MRGILVSFTKVQGHYHAHKLTLAGVNEDAFTRSLTSARVEMNPHQVDAALFALRSPLSKGVILADEVGLGKTIEAGLVISQRWAEHRRRIVLIVPASLRKQWQQELFDKFSLRSTIIEAATYNAMRKEGHRRPFEAAEGVVIISYEFAARKAVELELVKWDLVIFDEAHRLRNVYKKGGSQRAKDLKDALRDHFKILLTATPLQNSLMELYGIVSIIDDDHFGGENAFRAQYASSGTKPTALEVLKERLKPICHRTLRKQVQQAGHINFKQRNARTFTFDPTASEVQLYEALSEFLQRKDTISYGDKANQLVVLQVRKILGSSTFAVASYLEKLIERLKAKGRASLDLTDDIEIVDELAEEADEDSADNGSEPIDPAKLAAEVAELETYLELARSIGKNSKGEVLLSQLPAVLDEIANKGGKRKAVIFTESVRTQMYLNDLIGRHGYGGQIVLMNGSNSDADSKATYAAWKARHTGTDKISGSKSADMKAAIVEAFRSDEKAILIATESGAEGINLQFCSLLINFDLPWNPQRVEQRIGRCHRYGQLIDVTVVNMLNLKNQTEQRIHQLLSEKFHLFDGIFGASDEVLGTLVNGLDFEKEVLRIVQECRTEEQAEFEFNVLTESIKDRIDADMDAARTKVLGELDSAVVEKLHHRQSALATSIPEFRQRLLMVAHAELDAAVFPDPANEHFTYNGQTYTTAWPVADEQDWQFFRVSDGLGLQIVEAAKARDHASSPVAIHFKPKEYPYAGQMTAVNALSGQSGWMQVAKATMPTPAALREELLIACVTDRGEQIASEIADKMFMVPGDSGSSADALPDERQLEAIQADRFASFSDRVKRENFEWIEAEEERLDRYAADIEIELDAQVDAMEAEIKELQRQKRSADLSMEQKIELSRKIKRLEADVDDTKLSKFERRKQLRKEVSDKLDEFAEQLNQHPSIVPLMTVRWTVA
jgi:ERCC4-related helicase